MHNLVGQMHVSDKCILKSDKCILELSDKCRFLLSDKCSFPVLYGNKYADYALLICKFLT